MTRDEFRTAQLHQASEQYKFFDTNCDGRIQDSEQVAYEAWLGEKIRLPMHDYDRRKQAGVAVAVHVPAAVAASAPKAWSTTFLLRDSFEDVSAFSKPKDVKLASGAQLTWSEDGIGDNIVWSAKGVAALPIIWRNYHPPVYRGGVDPYLVAFSLVPAVNFQRVTNSSAAQKSKDVDALNFTGGVELAVGDLFGPYTTHYFRVRGGDLTKFQGENQYWSVTGEWQPITNFASTINIGSPNPLGWLPATYQIDTILRTQYLQNEAETISLPLFALKDEISRGGVVLGLSVAPQQGGDSPVPPWLQRLNFTASYSRLWDYNTNLDYEHYTAALGYALNEAGNVGLKLSYEGGEIEDTGQKVELTKVGLTAKY